MDKGMRVETRLQQGLQFGLVAQLVAQLTFNQLVVGSNPTGPISFLTLAPLTGTIRNMTKEELIELADDLIADNEEPDWEVDLMDQFASVFTDVTEDGKCLVIFMNNLNGDIEDAIIFNNEEEAEEHLNDLQAQYAEGEVDV
jgi:hypothetical protein